MQNVQNLSQLLQGLLMKFGSYVQKIFETQPFGESQILYCLIS
jgi:hypothetical protein